MKVYYKLSNSKCFPELYGNLIDLKCGQKTIFKSPTVVMNHQDSTVIWDKKTINLGIIIKLPKYYRLNLYVRSSLFSSTGLLLANGVGIIDGDCAISNKIENIATTIKADEGYNGENDVLKATLIAFDNVILQEGTRIIQAEIVPTMDCPWWIKFINSFRKIKFIKVDSFSSNNRGGLGSSGGY